MHHEPMSLKEAMMWALIALEQKALSSDSLAEQGQIEEAFTVLHEKLIEEGADGISLNGN